MVIIAAAMGFFLRVLGIFQRGIWPSANVTTVEEALRELFIGRCLFR
jgi:4-amino-4-deoxy-L-arabinose transferase-like glycosyltransferase